MAYINEKLILGESVNENMRTKLDELLHEAEEISKRFVTVFINFSFETFKFKIFCSVLRTVFRCYFYLRLVIILNLSGLQFENYWPDDFNYFGICFKDSLLIFSVFLTTSFDL